MPDDPWSKYLTKPETPPGAPPADDRWSKYEKPAGDPPAADQPGYLKQFGRGVYRGLKGDVLGAEQAAANIPGLSGLRPSAEDMASVDSSKDAGWTETAGRWVGSAAPFAIGGPQGGLAALATRAAIGGLAGAAQPTQSGSWQSHAIDATMGGLAAIIPGAPKGLLTSADALAGWATSFAAKTAMGHGESFFGEWALYDMVRRLGPATAAATFARWMNQPGVVGAAAGKATQKGQQLLGGDQGGSSDERSQ